LLICSELIHAYDVSGFCAGDGILDRDAHRIL
jgi:hypothetical protein